MAGCHIGASETAGTGGPPRTGGRSVHGRRAGRKTRRSAWAGRVSPTGGLISASRGARTSPGAGTGRVAMASRHFRACIGADASRRTGAGRLTRTGRRSRHRGVTDRAAGRGAGAGIISRAGRLPAARRRPGTGIGSLTRGETVAGAHIRARVTSGAGRCAMTGGRPRHGRQANHVAGI